MKSFDERVFSASSIESLTIPPKLQEFGDSAFDSFI